MSEVAIAERPAARLLYELTDVERMLGYYFHGGGQWSREDSPDDDMPKAKGNPARQNTHLAAMVDMDRAYRAMRGQLRNPWALWLYHAEGKTPQEIGRQLGISRQGIQQALDADAMALRDAMNEGRRPGRRGGLWPTW